MTFKEIADLGKKEGFFVDSSKGYFILSFKRKDNINVELSFPIDDPEIKNGGAISWEFILSTSGDDKEIYKDWRETYGENSLNDIYEDLSKFIEKVSKMDLRILEKSFLSFFKWKFGKYSKLEFETPKGWQSF
jgi:hypothetical protein